MPAFRYKAPVLEGMADYAALGGMSLWFIYIPSHQVTFSQSGRVFRDTSRGTDSETCTILLPHRLVEKVVRVAKQNVDAKTAEKTIMPDLIQFHWDISQRLK